MDWRVLLLAFVLTVSCSAALDVEIANSCGKTIVLGEYSLNGFIKLKDGGEMPDIPDVCEVTLEAGKGLSLHLRLVMIDFVNCNATAVVRYQEDGSNDAIFSSSPYFCGNKIFESQPVPLTFNDDSTTFKILFSKDNNDQWRKNSLLFDYSTKPIDAEDELQWPLLPPVISITTPTTKPTKVGSMDTNDHTSVQTKVVTKSTAFPIPTKPILKTTRGQPSDLPTDVTSKHKTEPSTTEPPTTEPPTTEPATTEPPTTEPPTTEPPTTESPTTEPQTTEPPTTKPPTTKPPKPEPPTKPPTTEPPTTEPSTTEPPTTEPPTTETPTTEPPTTEPPTTEPPTTEPPTTEPPTTKPPTTEPPTTEPPTTEPPTTETPTTEPPTTEPPTTEPPTTEPPTTEPPTTKPPTTEPPTTEPPTTKPPESEPPATKPPTTEPPTTEPPTTRPQTTELTKTKPPTTKPPTESPTTKPQKTEPPTTEPTTETTTPTTPALLQCMCSLGFKKEGSHHVSSDFPTVIPQTPYTIDISLSSKKSSCAIAKTRCEEYCRLFVVTRVSSGGDLDQIVTRKDFLKYLHLEPAQRPLLQRPLGDYVCEDYKKPLDGDGAPLFVFGHLPQCSAEPYEVHQIEKNFCCDGKGNRIPCSLPPVITEAKSTSEATSTLPPKTAKTTPIVSGTIRCQCIPVYYNGTKNVNKERRFAPSRTFNLPFSSCSSAETLCEQECLKFITGPKPGQPLNSTRVDKIADDVCTRITAEFNPDVDADLSLLELYSVLDNLQCRNVHHQALVHVLKRDFCCAGGHHEPHWSVGYIEPYHTTCKSLSFSKFTTPMIFPTDPPPTTKKPKMRKKYKCICSVGLQYENTFHATFKTMKVSDIAYNFPNVYSNKVSGCTAARNSCQRKCELEVDNIVYDGAIDMYESTICSKLGTPEYTPINLVLKSKPAGGTCGPYMNNGAVHELGFCCDGYTNTPCYTPDYNYNY